MTNTISASNLSDNLLNLQLNYLDNNISLPMITKVLQVH